MKHEDDDGFTLVELLVAIAILAIIIGPLTGSIIIGLTSTVNAQSRLTESRGILISSAFFGNDVQSSALPLPAPGTANAICGAATQAVVSFSWDDNPALANGPLDKVSYVVQTSAGGDRQLVRRFCNASGSVSSVVVVPLLHATTNPSVSCDVTCTTTPHNVTMTVTTKSGYQYTVTGRRRDT